MALRKPTGSQPSPKNKHRSIINAKMRLKVKVSRGLARNAVTNARLLEVTGFCGELDTTPGPEGHSELLW